MAFMSVPWRLIVILPYAVLALTGCAAISSRSVMSKVSSPSPPVYFAGVRTDYHILTESHFDETGWSLPSSCVIDMPFSFVVDVVLLPYDGYTDYRWSQRKYQFDESLISTQEHVRSHIRIDYAAPGDSSGN